MLNGIDEDDIEGALHNRVQAGGRESGLPVQSCDATAVQQNIIAMIAVSDERHDDPR